MNITIDYTAPKKEKFLQAYAIVGVITVAAKVADCNPRAHFNWMEEDPDYPARFAAAKEMAADRVEEEVVRRGVSGWEEPVFGTVYDRTGKPIKRDIVGYIRRFSDSLLMFWAKALRPGKFRERIDHTVKLPLDRAPLRLEELYEDLTSEPEPIDVESVPKLEEQADKAASQDGGE